MVNVLVVIPTFNERENIGILIDRIFALPVKVDVLVVDDSSPDGTADKVREKKNQFGNDRLHLIVRPQGKAGRGSACLEGFAFARKMGYDAAIEMDADLSHDPNDIPRFLEKLSGADVVIGSKYVAGSRIEGFRWYRRVLSYGANIYARLVLQLPIRDYTNGYRCYNAKALAKMPELTIDGQGFTVIPQMSYQLHRAGMRLTEIPIVFTNRRHGTSNMTLREIRESFFAILRIRSHALHLHAKQLATFAIIGVTNTLLNVSLLVFFVEIVRLPLLLAITLADGIAITNAFFMNKWWTFRNAERKYATQYMKFLIVYGLSFLLGVSVTWALVVVVGVWYILAKLVAIPLCAVWNYLWLHHGVFRERAA